MRINLSEQMSPSNVLEIIPETLSDQQLLMEWLGQCQSSKDFTKTVIAPLDEGGICIGFGDACQINKITTPS